VGEAARLLAVPVDGDGLALEGLADEAGQDHAVAARLPRSDRVEEPEDHHGETVLAVIGETEELVDRFGARVAPAALRRGAADAVVLLGQGDAVVLPVDLRAR